MSNIIHSNELALRAKLFNSITAGEWVVMPEGADARICVEGNPGWPIVVASAGPTEASIRFNERLISAAPEMLKALKAVMTSTEYGMMEVVITDLVEAAIKKAEGA